MARRKQATQTTVSKKDLTSGASTGMRAFYIDMNGAAVPSVAAKLSVATKSHVSVKQTESALSGWQASSEYVDHPIKGGGKLPIARAPFDRNMLVLAPATETYHGACIDAIVEGVVGEWKVSRWDGQEMTPADMRHRERIERFLETPLDPDALGVNPLRDAYHDYLTIGDGVLEISRDAQGYPAAMGHLPAHKMGVALDLENGGVRCYAQMDRHEVVAMFRKFDDTDADESLADKNEAVWFRRYSGLNDYYGIPTALRHWGAIVQRVLISEYNQVLFMNEGVPKFMVLLKGPWPEDAEEVLKNYLTNVFKGKHHKTLAVPLPDGCSLDIVYLIKDQRDASFLNLDKTKRDEIIHSHNVPPQAIGVVETGSLAGNASKEQMIEFRKKNNIRKREYGRIIQAVISSVPKWAPYKFEFILEDLDDKEQNARIDKIYLEGGVRTPAQVARDRFEAGDDEIIQDQETLLPLLRINQPTDSIDEDLQKLVEQGQRMQNEYDFQMQTLTRQAERLVNQYTELKEELSNG